jgi:hypothetical protein
MRTWRVLWEAVGGDDPEDFNGQAVPRPVGPTWDGHGAMPSGRSVRRKVVLPDGTRGLAYRHRPDGSYDVTLYRDGWPDVTLHPSEFRFTDRRPWPLGIRRR